MRGVRIALRAHTGWGMLGSKCGGGGGGEARDRDAPRGGDGKSVK